MKITEKIDNYLTEATTEFVDVEDKVKSVLIKYQKVDCCTNCFFSLPGWEGDYSCENPEVGMIVTGEKYHGQFTLEISPNGKCKFWKHGRENR